MPSRRYANETAELISKLLEEIVVELAAVKSCDMALHLAVAMLQVRQRKQRPPSRLS
jgi:hypothetical protein